MPEISIIVPVYKAEKYLEKCVDSILAQTMQDFELILVNDGSPDDSQRIIDRYCAEQPQRIRSLTLDNGGQGRARNRGIDICTGKYIGFVDSDDWIEPDMYEKLWQTAEKDGADLVVCDFYSCYHDGAVVYEKCIKGNYLLESAGSCCNKLFRRDAVGGIRYPEGLWYEDFNFSAKLLLKAEKVSYIPEALYSYRIGQPSTMSNNNSLKNLDIITIMEDIRVFMEECGKSEEFEYLLINHVLLDSINRVENQRSNDKKEVIEKMLDYIHRHIPYLPACRAYKEESRNRRIIMFLNYNSLEAFSRLILKVKKALK